MPQRPMIVRAERLQPRDVIAHDTPDVSLIVRRVAAIPDETFRTMVFFEDDPKTGWPMKSATFPSETFLSIFRG